MTTEKIQFISEDIDKPKCLDLYCGGGGASYGFEQAGFDVTGIDLYPQPRYKGNFIQADAIEYLLEYGHLYDFIHASPPCQEYTQATKQFRMLGKTYPTLVEATRAAFIKVGRPCSMENVVGSPLINPILLCGTMFGLPTYRHRLFETSFPIQAPIHPIHLAKNAKMGRRVKEGEFIQYVGHFSGVKMVQDFTGLHWLGQNELRESIPPQYTKWLGEYVIKNVLSTNIEAA